MGQLTASFVVSVNLDTVFTVQDLKSKYLPGLPIPDSITNETLQFYVNSAIEELQSYLGLRLQKQVIEETKDFSLTDWSQWGYMPTTYPVVCAVAAEGFLGTTKQITYPREWLSTRKTSDHKWYSRQIHIVPTSNSALQGNLIYSGIMPYIGYNGSKEIPNYWKLKYVTGWTNLPLDLMNALGMLAAVKVLQIISDALMIGALQKVVNQDGQQVFASNGASFGGMGLGISSKSISIDGLSQSTSSYVNGTTGIWGARLKQYADLLNPEIQGSLMRRLYDQYSALTMSVA